METSHTDTFTNGENLPNPGDYWALLQRLASSPRLKRSARMRSFLLYVGKRSLESGGQPIHEEEIGAEAFGRPAGYDTNLDNIVRVTATELRKRIEAYFEEEGADEPLILEIPRGSYTPVFRRRSSEPLGLAIQAPPAIHVDPEPFAPPKAPASATGIYRRSLTYTIPIIALLAILLAASWLQNRELNRSLYAWEDAPALASLWSGILDAKPNTDVVLADTSFALIEDITKKPIPLSGYLSRNYTAQIQSPDLSQDRRDDLALIAARNFGSLGDFRAAQRIVALDPRAKRLHVYYARDYTPALIKQNNVILIGSRKSNPWVDLFSDRLNFMVQYDPEKFVSSIKNRAPAPGEEQIYTTPPAPEAAGGYSVVAYLPNSEQNGKVLIIQGTGAEATEGAGDFLTSEEQLQRFQKMLHVNKLPYFEVLLKTTHLIGTPLDAKILAYRTYPNLH
jgi:hypothetical protein